MMHLVWQKVKFCMGLGKNTLAFDLVGKNVKTCIVFREKKKKKTQFLQ